MMLSTILNKRLVFMITFHFSVIDEDIQTQLVKLTLFYGHKQIADVINNITSLTL